MPKSQDRRRNREWRRQQDERFPKADGRDLADHFSDSQRGGGVGVGGVIYIVNMLDKIGLLLRVQDPLETRPGTYLEAGILSEAYLPPFHVNSH